MREELNRLFEALAAAYRGEGRAGGDDAAEALIRAQSAELDLAHGSSAPKSLIRRAAGQAGGLPLIDSVAACCDCFDWQHWAVDKLDEAVSSKLYSTELIGPDGLIRDSRVRVGLLVSEAGTDYPQSSHSGEETYYVIAGTAQWTVDGGAYRPHKPGALVHHPAWAPHGRRTLEQVFVGAWRWSGDLALDSFRVEKPH